MWEVFSAISARADFSFSYLFLSGNLILAIGEIVPGPMYHPPLNEDAALTDRSERAIKIGKANYSKRVHCFLVISSIFSRK